MEYPILIAIMSIVSIAAIVTVILTLSKALSGRKNGAFRMEIKLGKFVFVLDFSSSKA